MEQLQTLWNKALTIIEGKISKPSFETWLQSTKASALVNDQLTIIAPNEFARDWLESRYSSLIQQTLYEVTGETFTIKFIIPPSMSELDFIPDQSPKKKIVQTNDDDESQIKSILNPKYVFDTFVIGAGNRFAHAASLAVAEAVKDTAKKGGIGHAGTQA